MTIRYFAEKQLRRYPLKSAVYFAFCFFFVAVLVLFGTASFSLREVKRNLSTDNPMDCVVVSSDCGVSRSELASLKNAEWVEEQFLSESFDGELRLSPERKLSLKSVSIFFVREGLPKRAADAFSRENGRSPILYGRDLRSESEVVLDALILRKRGVPENELSSFLGASVVRFRWNYFTMESEEIAEMTIVGICDSSFSEQIGRNEAPRLVMRASASKRAAAYEVYPKRGMLRAVYNSLLNEFGEDSVWEWRDTEASNADFSGYAALFDRIFIFLGAILSAAFLGVTIFTVVFYTEKQTEFHAVAAAFGARRRNLLLSEILLYVTLLFSAVLLSCLVSALLQNVLLNVLSGYFEAPLRSLPIPNLFAVGGIVFGVFSACVAVGVPLGTLAVKKRNL